MTCEDVRAAWAANVWPNVTMNAYTDKFLPYGETLNSEAEIEDVMSGQEINYVNYLVSVQKEFGVAGEITSTYFVTVTYTRAQDTTGEAWGEVRDFFEDLFLIVQTTLGDSWHGTVDFWLPPENEIDINRMTLDSTPCWTATAQYKGKLTAAV